MVERERVKKIIFSRLIFTASYHHLRWFAASVTTFRYLEIKNVLKHVIYMPTRRNALKYTCFSYWICKLHHDLDTDMYVVYTVCSIYTYNVWSYCIEKKITLAVFTKGNLVVKNIYSTKNFRVLHQTLPSPYRFLPGKLKT